MKFWIVKGTDDKIYITCKDEKPIREKEPSKRNYLHTGWDIGFPGSADINDVAQMYGLFGIFYDEGREILNKVPLPKFYEDNPREVDIDLKICWYG